MRLQIWLVILLAMVLVANACAPSLKLARGFLGISVDSLRNQTRGRFSAVCNASYHDCFTKTVALCKDMKADVFVQSEKERSIGASHFNSVFSDCLDATDVGIFFDPVSPGATRIDVVSSNSRLSEFVSEELTAKLKVQVLPDRSSKGGAHGG